MRAAFVHGAGRTLRINGRAAINTNPELCASFTMEGKLPRSVIVVTAERVYTQCPKALVRSHLWDASRHVGKRIGGLLLAASVMLASTSATQAQSSSMWPWNWGMAECKAGYKYDSSKNVCRAEKKKKKVAKKKSGGKKKKA